MSDVVFDADAMMASAAAFAGLDDYGDQHFITGLKRLIETYDHYVVEEFGRQKIYNRVLKLLAARLRITAAQKKHPEIAKETITRPMVLTGLPRTGTSALFNLMANDPASRALLQWETHYPDPIDGLDADEMDPRRRKLIDKIEAQRAANPEFDTIHFASADTPEECVLLHALDFNGVQLGFECMLEPYLGFHQQSDLLPMYEYYKSLLQMLQWREPGERWLLKAPAHMWGLDALTAVMPDVCILWGHRNPLQVIPSISSLTSLASKMYAGNVPALAPEKLGPIVMEFYARSLERGIALREKMDKKYFFDYRFKDFVDQPMRLLQDCYDYFYIDMSEDVHNKLQAHIDANPKGKHGKHEYNYEKFGLSEQIILDRFAFYINDDRYSDYL